MSCDKPGMRIAENMYLYAHKRKRKKKHEWVTLLWAILQNGKNRYTGNIID